MNYTVGQTLHGFHLNRREEIPEIQSTGLVFEHLKTGARLLYLRRDDDNKLFSITFRTPPVDSTGIPHILEHSVLCGSRKYPSREPFVELAKGSLNTFLNAMTFPDKTMYPVASRNARDFMNLMDVYLDAVFFPNIYRYQEIFMQEGWHYELDSPGGALEYRGVVYNEMKGVFSSPESVLFRKIPESLYPDTPYAFESGGDPEDIPRLTYEQFLSYHRRHYHPSNSWICLYGDGDVAGHLEYLDTGYLRKFERIETGSGLPLQPPFVDQRELSVPYAVLPHENEKDRTYLSMNFSVGTNTDPVLSLACTMLEHLLLETPAAPLKKALLDAGIGKDVFGQFERDLLQPVLSVVAKNTGRDKAAGFQHTVTRTLERLADAGIDRRLKEASINIHEFRLREADFRGLPRGLVYCWSALRSWLYGGDPFIHLSYESSLGEIKKALGSDYFERLIRERLLDNRHRSLVAVYPEKGMLERKNGELRDALERHRSSLTEAEIGDLIDQTGRLKKRQSTPDPPELLEKIPLLSLEDIDREAERLPLEERTESNLTVLFHPVFTSGIAYINLLFDSTGVPAEDLPYLSLLAGVLGKAGTRKLGYGELANEINLHTGGISFGNEAFGDKDDDLLYRPRMMVRSKVLVEKLPRLWDILGEILAGTRFDDRKRIREIVQESISRYEMSLYDQGHYLAAGRLLSSFSPRGAYEELIGGISFLHFLREVNGELDHGFDRVSARLGQVLRQVAAGGNLTVSVTADAGDYGRFRETLPALLDRVPDSRPVRHRYRLENGARAQALLTPGSVQYVAKGHNFRRAGFGYRGSLRVLRTVASLDYLWNRVRVQGGAYGCFAQFSRNGTAYFCSYRDPNLSETLAAYDQAAGYFRSFQASPREITKYIIGTVSRLDHPLTPSMKGEVADRRYMQNITHQDVQHDREEVLSTGVSDIREAAGLIEEIMRRNYLCVMGSEQTLRAQAHLFEKLVNVF